jgi:hypothetical protein
MLMVFFVLNLPVNKAVASWTLATIPPDWAAYRLRWEIGHAIALLLSLCGVGALLWARSREKHG